MKFFFTIFFSIHIHLIYSQIIDVDFYYYPDLKSFYPSKIEYKKNKVKSIIDTFGHGNSHYKEEFDTLGRQTSWYYIENTSRTNFRYEIKNDTLFKYHYCPTYLNGETYQMEKYVYNKIHQIIYYLNCHKHTHDNGTDVEMTNFYYNDRNKLTEMLDYKNSNYPEPFSINMLIEDSLLELRNVTNFSYNKRNNISVLKELYCDPEFRKVDSFFYDKSNRISRIISTQKKRWSGEFIKYNTKTVIEIEYKNLSKRITITDSSNDFITGNNFIDQNARREIEKEEIIYEYLTNGLIVKEFFKSNSSGKMQLNHYYVYGYYDN